MGILRSDLVRLGHGIEAVHAEVGRLRGDCAESVTRSNDTMQQLRDVVEWKATQQDLALDSTIAHARDEFVQQRTRLETLASEAEVLFRTQQAALQELHAKTEASMLELANRVRAVEGHGGEGGDHWWPRAERERSRGYLPLKSLQPQIFDGKVEKWRAWKDDVIGFLEAANKGLGMFLKKVGEEADAPDERWVNMQTGEFGINVTGEGAELWRTLKALTEGEAQGLVIASGAGHGFTAVPMRGVCDGKRACRLGRRRSNGRAAVAA